MDQSDCQKAINGIREDIVKIDKRLMAQEIYGKTNKETVSSLKHDFYNLQSSIRVDIESVKVSLHKDIKIIQDTLTDLVKQQAVEEARMSASVGMGKWLIEKMPWLLAIGASAAAVVQFIKDKAP